MRGGHQITERNNVQEGGEERGRNGRRLRGGEEARKTEMYDGCASASFFNPTLFVLPVLCWFKACSSLTSRSSSWSLAVEELTQHTHIYKVMQELLYFQGKGEFWYFTSRFL